VTRKPRTLRRQLLTWLVAPLTVLWSISTYVDYEIANRSVRFAYDQALLESAFDIGRQVKVLGGRIYVDLPEVAAQMLQTRETGRVYYLVTGPGNEYISGEPDLPPPPDPLSERVNYYNGKYGGKPIRAVAMKLPLDSGGIKGQVLVRVAEDQISRIDLAREIILGMMLLQAVLIIITALAVWYAIGRGLAPLASLQREIAARSHRDLSALPEEQAPKEVQPLIRAMNDLLERLSKVLAAQQRLTADAAHQLRTPIAGIKTQAELALRQARSPETREPLQRLQTATDQTTRLVNQLLSLARAEPGSERAHAKERLDLGKLAREATSDWVTRAISRNIDLGFEGPGVAAPVQGESSLLKEMLNNLLDNAIRYTQPGGQVTVRIVPDTDRVVLSVEDNGPGIPEADRERVFERFFRVLGTGVEGCGLGLAIVREIARNHGTDAVLTSGANDTGTVVRVAFPRAA
jgi:two-component system, OmpR family, sensor histidine kinase TctE